MRDPVADTDESDLSEITILPDGRVYAFGITRQVTELLHSLEFRSAALARASVASALDKVEVRRPADSPRRSKESD
jgi:hypothetical protein